MTVLDGPPSRSKQCSWGGQKEGGIGTERVVFSEKGGGGGAVILSGGGSLERERLPQGHGARESSVFEEREGEGELRTLLLKD